MEDAIRDYIEYYNKKRIIIKLKGLTSIEYRQLVLS
ncbi:IS3 family transposase [Lactobacillus sp. ESL0228]|nr:IS3 family transposase [Lactobacillus sp. ESL0228]